MKLYHASSLRVESPDVFHSREFLDFGKGFYLTSLYEQAEKYGQRFLRRNLEAWINVYDFDCDLNQWEKLIFNDYSGDWLQFVADCRAGKDLYKYDIVVGGIANDKVIRTLDRYFAGEITSDEALGLLKYEKPNIQYCIRTQRLIDSCLKHIESKQL